MTMPNIGRAISLVAPADVSAATPPVVTNPVNISGVTRTGAGIWVVTIVDPCDILDRFVTLTANFATDAKVILDPAVQTDTTIGVLGFIGANGAGAATDVAWATKVERIHLTPS